MAVVSIADRRTSLQSCPLFASLDSDTLALLAEAVMVETFGADEDVCLKGEPADCVYLVHQGALDVLLPDQELPVTQLRRHDLFGEYGMFTGVRTTGIRASELTILLSIDHPRFRALIHQFPSIMFGLLEVTVHRLIRAESRMAGISRDVPRNN